MKGKTVRYESSGGFLPLNEVVYVIYGRQIVFSGLHSAKEGRVGSTINFAEQIIAAIAKAEKLDPRRHQFLDLQTHKGYGRYKPGNFAFNLLKPIWQKGCELPVGMSWCEGHPDLKVIEDFSECIWGDNSRSTPRNLPV
ncbi:MAG TPA: hypothetical protein VHC46_00510, partial [Thermodesulfobacteriota bacterium]|nr:hypothetical protein [Thermodesulfobacteriota bacterium]